MSAATSVGSIDDPPPPGARGNAAVPGVAVRRAVLREQIKELVREHTEAFGRWVAERTATPASDQS